MLEGADSGEIISGEEAAVAEAEATEEEEVTAVAEATEEDSEAQAISAEKGSTGMTAERAEEMKAEAAKDITAAEGMTNGVVITGIVIEGPETGISRETVSDITEDNNS